MLKTTDQIKKRENTADRNTVDLAFQELYIRCRKKENRIYTNQEVAMLPDIHPAHFYYSEWKARKESANRLIQYLQKKNKPLRILEVGSGNGWLSAKMACIRDAVVSGLEINQLEFRQSITVFHDRPNLNFVYGDLRDNTLDKAGFDIIVFAASLQYFPSLNMALQPAFELLKAGGEIHIMDTHFYTEKNITSAKERTNTYYAFIGCAEMSGYYFHHSFNELQCFPLTIMFDPFTWKNKLLRKAGDFYWIRMKR